MDLTITKLVLDNGLSVLLREIHTAPIISQWLWYRVGSRNEVPGRTGISHWVEHMQFKGTEQFPQGQADRAISREGGSWNAFTFLDWTTYFETMPSAKIDIALRLEADRMCSSLFDPAEVDSERTVIISERQGNENEPMFRLNEEVQAAAFRVHPYHHEIIGDLPDLETMTRDDLYRHYRMHYLPNNAVLTMAGDFDTPWMADRIRELYGAIPAGPAVAQPARREPPQAGERRITIEGPGETTYIQLAYRVPQATHPDFIPAMVLDSLLTGPSGLNMFGGGLSNKTSRLYRALVETELAVSVTGGLAATIDPYLYTITAAVHPRRHPEEVISAIEREILAVQETLPVPAELQRAVKQAKALFAYGSESITNQAFWLGFTEMFATFDWFVQYIDRLTEVTPEDVERIARQYLRPQNRVTGVYLPDGNNGGGGE